MRLNSYLQIRVDAEKRMVQLLPFSLDKLQQGQVPIEGLSDLRWRGRTRGNQVQPDFTSDFLAGLYKWTRLASAAALPPVLVYGGDDNMIRQGVTVQS